MKRGSGYLWKTQFTVNRAFLILLEVAIHRESHLPGSPESPLHREGEASAFPESPLHRESKASAVPERPIHREGEALTDDRGLDSGALIPFLVDRQRYLR